ncbi:MAG: histidinol dehydrogenase, partial [Clostridia bacterium]|nr:histidinol dehydrogenase [Clostridia bacterium]
MLKIVYGAPKMNAGRDVQDTSKYEEIVKDIIKDVRVNGDEALLKYARKFDCETLESLKVTQAEIDEAVGMMDEGFMAILKEAKENIENYHKNQKRDGFSMTLENGVKMGQVILPLESVGAYVPGGTAAYPSSVFMNLIPARIAGVKRIVLTTPAGRDGKIPAPLLAAANLCGVNEIYKTGGAQAVAALAFGTDT